MPADTGVPLLLDTHVWVWVVAGDETRLAPRVVSRIERAVRDGRCLVSVISVWEVAMLEAKGRLRLGGALDAWVAAARRPPGVTIAELSPDIAIESTRLPGEVHGDPADRMLIAMARNLGAVLVTCDERILVGGDRLPQWAFELAAAGQDVSLAGGAQAAQQYLAAGLVDEMEISLVPTLLGRGERLFDGGVGDDLHGLALVRTVAAPGVTHLEFARH